MPDPHPHPQIARIRRVAWHALVAGVVVMAAKFSLFYYTSSAAVLSDALESIINLVAAAFMLYSIWLSNRRPDKDHPYGHGKVEFMTVGLEGWLILMAGLVIAWQAVSQLIFGPRIQMDSLDVGNWLLAGVAAATAGLGGYVWWSGRTLQSKPLIADGKHLITDAVSTLGVFGGLWLVKWTGWTRLDPVVALLMAGLIFFTSWQLMWESIGGLMDRIDPADDAAIRAILDEEIAAGTIKGYHKVRHRHTGDFHWVDLHLQLDGAMNVTQAHELASRIEGRIEAKLVEADATAHIEPWVEQTEEHATDSPEKAD